jgi:hypothetical protein
MTIPSILLLLSCSSSPEENIGYINTPRPKQDKQKLLPLDPLEGKSLKEICESNFLSLTKWRYDILQSNFKKLCCTAEGINNNPPCGQDWPFSGVPSCSAYDELKNGILALHGYPFKGQMWRDHFEKEEWYVRRIDYSESWLSAQAIENISTLMYLKETKVHCTSKVQ